MRHAKKLVVMLLVASILSSVLAVGASAAGALAYGAATVSAQGLRVRLGPDTSHKVIDNLSEGDIVVILERTNSEWYKINFHGVVGYVSVLLLRDILTVENFYAQGRATADRVNIRTGNKASSDIMGTCKKNTEMTVIGIDNGWYKVKFDGKTGYIRSDLLEIISGFKSSSAASKSSTRVTPSAPAPNPNVALGTQISEFAQEFVGYEYIYGGTSPSGFDCSGLVTYVYKSFGISVTRTASGQYRDNGAYIEKSELFPGDLVFFSNNGLKSVTHVGIYIGDNEFVHASRPGIGVVISRLDSTYYVKGFFGAKRLVSK